MSNWRVEIVKRTEAHTGNELDCLHVIISSNSNVEIADTYIPLDDIAAAIKRYKMPDNTPTRRSEGARIGWEIRRAKQAKKANSG